MPYPPHCLNKYIQFFTITSFLIGLLWHSGCSTQQETAIPSKTSVTTLPSKDTEKTTSIKGEKGITEESLKCITCHEERGITHGWVADWEGSKHARMGVGCESCHINLVTEPAIKEATELEYFCTDGSACEDKRVQRQVIAGTCGKCHVKQYSEFMKSRHSIGWKRMLDCGRSAALSPKTRSAQCEQCHNIQFKCDSCHTRHTFNTLEAKTPEACRTCHIGPDNPQYEIYISSKHGAVYSASQSSILKESQSIQALRSPVCITCHMPKGSHDISFGLAYGPAGVGTSSYINRDGISVDEIELIKRRNDMLSVCNTCHSLHFAKKTLSTADTLHKNVEAIVKEAQDIITGLENEKLTFPAIGETANITFFSHALILDNPQLSRMERLFSRLAYSASITWKGAYHMNPNYTHLHGWIELQKNLSDIKEEAKKLREEAELRRKMEIKLR